MQTVSGLSFRERFDNFLAGPRFVMTAALLTAVSFALRGELVLYTIFCVLVMYICFGRKPMQPVMPMVAFAYLAPSTANNPGKTVNSVFFGDSGKYIIFVGCLIVLSVVYRIIVDRKQFFKADRKMLLGMLLLAAAYLLGGIGTPGYSKLWVKNIIFALVQGVSVLVPYWLFTAGVDWEKLRKDYFSWVGFGAGFLLLFEILFIYLTENILRSGIIYRTGIYTGWGMYNNVGCMLAMMIPFGFSLARHYHRDTAAIFVGTIFLGGVFLTASRTSIIFGTLGYLACVFLILFYTNDRRGKLKRLIVVGVIGIILVLAFHRPILRLFTQVVDNANELLSRVEIYGRGFKQFLRNPVTGTGFYPAKGQAWGWSTTDISEVLPDRWHNTVVQLLASTGTLGILAYGFHRYQTYRVIRLFRTRRQWLMAISILIMLFCSLLDCHFFNIGPTLFYSMTLVVAEKRPQ